MSGYVNWADTLEPIQRLNQPHLFFYFMAGITFLFGPSEIALHLLMSLFAGLCILFFYKTASELKIKHGIFVTTLFVAGPAFITSQNVMTNIPMLSFMLIFLWALVRDSSGNYFTNHLIAATACSLALLTKYKSLILLPILLVDILLKRQWKSLWTLLLPILSLSLWSLFNYLDYGGIHILERPTSDFAFRIIDVVIGLGAISPFSVLLFSSIRNKLEGKVALVSALGGMILFLIWRWYEEPNYNDLMLLGCFFIGNGLFILTFCLLLLIRQVRRSRPMTV